eukprot:1841171-Rhodomonas_salina.1
MLDVLLESSADCLRCFVISAALNLSADGKSPPPHSLSLDPSAGASEERKRGAWSWGWGMLLVLSLPAFQLSLTSADNGRFSAEETHSKGGLGCRGRRRGA